MAARQFKLAATVDHFAAAFASFALLLAPYWLFGFGQAAALRHLLRTRLARLGAPGLLVIPYLCFAVARGQVQATYVLIFLLLPVALAAVFEYFPSAGGLGWQDGLVLLAVGLPVEFGWFRGAWPDAGLSALPKLLLLDAVLYAFLVVRRMDDIGYDFRPCWRDLAIGLREWALFAPLAIGLGFALHFLRFRAFLPYASSVAAAWLITFFFVAVPEELFFRGLLQSLLEKRLDPRPPEAAAPAGDRDSPTAHFPKSTSATEGSPPNAGAAFGGWKRSRAPRQALLIAAVIFGLSHFNKPLPFNWRYVLLAAIAGIFYGRAWRDRRRLLCSAITHATVDVVWSVWFR